jgi:organic radical activating enzyme
MGVNELLKDMNSCSHVCITGGEPLLHDLLPLVERCFDIGIKVHIETSGTLPIPTLLHKLTWITCSPKVGFMTLNIGYVHEFKFVVDVSDESDQDVLDAIYKTIGFRNVPRQPVFIQPIADMNTLKADSTARVLRLQRMDPRLRISVQTHKVLGVL